MHIAVLSDPNNFHTQKWATALQAEGAKVTIFSFFPSDFTKVPCVYIAPKFTQRGKLTYWSYLYSGKRLLQKLREYEVDIANPINITPFGVWAARSGFRPLASLAMGSDILEYPPKRNMRSFSDTRAWSSKAADKQVNTLTERLKWHFFRREVQKALNCSEYIAGDNLVLVDAIRNWFRIPEHKVELNRWGIEPEKFVITEAEKQNLRQKYGIKKGMKVVFSPRGLKPIYQGDIVLKACAQLLESGREDICCIILSAGYEIPESVLKNGRELALTYKNFYLEEGLLPREEILKLWNIVDIFISMPVYDGNSNALAEGRYIGAIPIVNAIPANTELITHRENGWILEDTNPNTLFHAISEVLLQFDTLQPLFAERNKHWIIREALLQNNVRKFLDQCERRLMPARTD